MICRNCGNDIDKNENFCRNCGAPAEASDQSSEVKPEPTPIVDTYGSVTPEQPPKPFGINTSMLIWSIINIVCCCTPLGVAGLVFNILAGNTADQKEYDDKQKYAKICNIIGTAGGALVLIFYIIYMIALVALGVYGETL